MNTLLAIAAVALTTPWSQAPATINEPAQQKLATLCFKSGENVSGMNKICFYNCLGSTVAITIGSIELCPLTINN